MKKVYVKSMSNYGTKAKTKFELLHFFGDNNGKNDAIRISVKTVIPKDEEKSYIKNGYCIKDGTGFKDFCIKRSTLLKGLNKLNYPRKLYRRVASSLNESLNTIKEVTCLEDILDLENKNMRTSHKQPDYFDGIMVKDQIDMSDKLGKEWKDEHLVLLHSEFFKDDYKWACMGYCNFKE